MDRFHRNPVDAGLHGPKPPKGLERPFPRARRDWRFPDDPLDGFQGAPVGGRPAYVMGAAAGLSGVGIDPELLRGHTAFHDRLKSNIVAGQIEFAEMLFQSVQGKAQVEHRPQEHVTARPGETIEIDGFHDFDASRLMRWAWQPAPKPLSILTTEMPSEHEVSIAKRAVSPPRLAP